MGSSTPQMAARVLCLVLIVAAWQGTAAAFVGDLSNLEGASPTDDLASLSKEELLSFLTGQNADLKKQNAKQNAAHEEQNAAHEMQNADLKKQNAALKARLDGASRLAAAKKDELELGEQNMMQTAMQERFGFGGMMTAGSFVEQPGVVFEKKELGEVALVSDPSTLESGGTVSSTTGLGPSACSNSSTTFCNPALCEGHIPGFTGGLNCPSFTSDECPDDLSGLSFFQVAANGRAKCKTFGQYHAISSILACYPYGTGRICTKAAFMHPHGAAKHVVAIMLKRLVCSGDPETCLTYKMGYCISNSNEDPYFSSTRNHQIQSNEIKPAYEMLRGSWTDIFDTENGGITEDWVCGEEDTQKFREVLMAF